MLPEPPSFISNRTARYKHRFISSGLQKGICPCQSWDLPSEIEIFVPDLLKALVYAWTCSIVDNAPQFARAVAVGQEDS